MRRFTTVWASVGRILVVALGVLLLWQLGGQSAQAQQDVVSVGETEGAQAAIDEADALWHAINIHATSLSAAASVPGYEGDLTGQVEELEDILSEAASDLQKAETRLRNGDPEGALEDAEEALEELEKARY